MELSLVLGTTCTSGNCLTGNDNSGLIAYAASNTVVLFDTLQLKQIGYLRESRQTISCMNFSSDGTHFLTGHVGYKPTVGVWNIGKKDKLAALQGHDCGIRCVAFSPNLDVIVSIGIKFDGFVIVWGWPNQCKLACNRFSDEINAMAYDPCSKYFVTCGVHHVKFWYPGSSGEPPNEGKTHPVIPMQSMTTLYGRQALLEHIKTSTFISIACGKGKSAGLIFVVSKDGYICRMSSSRTVDHVERLKVTKLSTVCVNDDLLAVGSKCGNILFFDSLSMKYKSAMSFPIDKCFAAQAKRLKMNWKDIKDKDRKDLFLYYDGTHKLLSAICVDGSFCLWDIGNHDNVSSIIKYYANSHHGSISDTDCFQIHHPNGKNKDCLVTVSHDTTIRLWELRISNDIGCDRVRTIYTDFSKQQADVDNFCYDYGKSVITAVTHLLSGSRDRHIHVYDVNNEFALVNTLCFHSGSLTSINTRTLPSHGLLVSTAMDRSLVISHSEIEKATSYTVKFNRILSSSVMGFVYHEVNGQLFLVVGTRAGEIYIIKSTTCSIVRSFRASLDSNARLEKLCLEQNHNILLTSCSNRSINVLNILDGAILCSVTGHGSASSSVHFFGNKNRIITTSQDGCIFIWDLPPSIMKNKMTYGYQKHGLDRNVITREILVGKDDDGSLSHNINLSEKMLGGDRQILSGLKVVGPKSDILGSSSSASDSLETFGEGSSLFVDTSYITTSKASLESSNDFSIDIPSNRTSLDNSAFSSYQESPEIIQNTLEHKEVLNPEEPAVRVAYEEHCLT